MIRRRCANKCFSFQGGTDSRFSLFQGPTTRLKRQISLNNVTNDSQKVRKMLQATNKPKQTNLIEQETVLRIVPDGDIARAEKIHRKNRTIYFPTLAYAPGSENNKYRFLGLHVLTLPRRG